MSTNGARSHQNYKYIDEYVALSCGNLKGSAAVHELDYVLTDLPHLKNTTKQSLNTHWFLYFPPFIKQRNET